MSRSNGSDPNKGDKPGGFKKAWSALVNIKDNLVRHGSRRQNDFLDSEEQAMPEYCRRHARHFSNYNFTKRLSRYFHRDEDDDERRDSRDNRRGNITGKPQSGCSGMQRSSSGSGSPVKPIWRPVKGAIRSLGKPLSPDKGSVSSGSLGSALGISEFHRQSHSDSDRPSDVVSRRKRHIRTLWENPAISISDSALQLEQRIRNKEPIPYFSGSYSLSAGNSPRRFRRSSSKSPTKKLVSRILNPFKKKRKKRDKK